MKKNVTKKPLKTFTIVEEKWLNGNTGKTTFVTTSTNSIDDSALWNGRRKHSMCCLGQIGEQCGIPKKELKYKPQPIDVIEEYQAAFPTFLFDGTEDDGLISMECREAMTINDSINDDNGKKITLAARKKALRALFKEHGYTLRFVP